MIRSTMTRYVIKLHEQETTTASGIIVKGSGDTQLAEIVYVGSEVEKPHPVGATIVVDWSLTLPVKHKNEQFFIVDHKNILGIVE